MYWLIRYNQLFEKLLLLAVALKTPSELPRIQSLYGWLCIKFESMPESPMKYDNHLDPKQLIILEKSYKKLLAFWAKLSQQCLNLGIENVSKSELNLWCKDEISKNIFERDEIYFTEKFARNETIHALFFKYQQEDLEKENKSKLKQKEVFKEYLYWKLYEQYENNFISFMHNEFHLQLAIIYENLDSNIIDEQIFEYLDALEQIFLKKTKNNPSIVEVLFVKGIMEFVISSKEERAIELVKQIKIIRKLLAHITDLEIKKHLQKRILYLLDRYPLNRLYFKAYKIIPKK